MTRQDDNVLVRQASDGHRRRGVPGPAPGPPARELRGEGVRAPPARLQPDDARRLPPLPARASLRPALPRRGVLRRHRDQRHRAGQALLHEPRHGGQPDGGRPAGEGGQVRRHRHRVQLPRLPRRAPQGGRPLGRPLPRQRGQLRADQEDDGRAGAGLQAAVRARLDPPDPDEPVRTGRLVQPRAVARRGGPGAEVRRGRDGQGARRSRSGAPASRCASSSTSRTAPTRSCWRPRQYDDAAKPLNIGTGIGTTIRELAETVCAASGYRGEDGLEHRQARRGDDEGARRDPDDRGARRLDGRRPT